MVSMLRPILAIGLILGAGLVPQRARGDVEPLPFKRPAAAQAAAVAWLQQAMDRINQIADDQADPERSWAVRMDLWYDVSCYARHCEDAALLKQTLGLLQGTSSKLTRTRQQQLGLVVGGLANAGRVKEAEALVRGCSDPTAKSRGLLRLVDRYVELKDVNSALRVAGLIPEADAKRETNTLDAALAYGGIAAEMTRQGHLAEARALLKQHRTWASRRLVEALGDLGDYAAAFRLLREPDFEPTEAAEGYIGIAEAQRQRGDLAASDQTMAAAEKVALAQSLITARYYAVLHLAEAYAERHTPGDDVEALRLIAAAQPLLNKLGSFADAADYGKIGAEYARAGDLASARAWMAKLSTGPHPKDWKPAQVADARAQIVQQIARRQARDKDVVGALATAAAVTDPEDLTYTYQGIGAAAVRSRGGYQLTAALARAPNPAARAYLLAGAADGELSRADDERARANAEAKKK